MTRSWRLAVLTLLAACLSAAALLQLDANPAVRPVDAAASPGVGPTVTAAKANAADPDQQAWVTTVLGRPLFAPTRRPPPAAVAQGGDLSDLPRLAGILISPFGKLAIFATGGAARPVAAGEGGRVGEWSVQSIADGQVVLRGADGPHPLHLRFESGTRMPVASPVPQPSGTAATLPNPAPSAIADSD